MLLDVCMCVAVLETEKGGKLQYIHNSMTNAASLHIYVSKSWLALLYKTVLRSHSSVPADHIPTDRQSGLEDLSSLFSECRTHR
jgi:hypothetical protein